MIANISINSKSFNDTVLYNGLEFNINEGEKIGLIGRNGTGKSTLFNMISGEDKDFDGEISLKKNLIVTSSRQEHQDFEDKKVIDYILEDLPEYSKLKNSIDTLPDKMGENEMLIQRYSDALERFGVLGYYEVEEEVLRALTDYQIDETKSNGKLGQLSGGQKRLIELVKVQRARADLALIDEPTNHMDYIAKESFIKWLRQTKEAVVVISHDRDVLKAVDRIIEIRDGQADICKGNYDAFLSNNTTKITSEISQYGVNQRRISNLEDNIIKYRRFKEKARNPSTIQRFKRLENQSVEELKKLKAVDKPSFWIDQESTAGLKSNIADAYDEHKTKNITIRTKNKSESTGLLIELDKLSLGYEDPLFKDVSIQIRSGDKVQIHGRNGVGKSTLVKGIISTSKNTSLDSRIFDGSIILDKNTKIGVYEQELDPSYLKLSLGEAIEQAYHSKGLSCTDQQIKNLLNDYLFNPITDGQKPLSILSGGQKARFQLINMLAGDPNVLILDEPTNHLDLPSIEELEMALDQYSGAIIYISHDSYFVEKLSGHDIGNKIIIGS